mgnify:CR=1 FL=1
MQRQCASESTLVGSTGYFVKLALAEGLGRLRERQRLTQTDVARRIGSSQSVAKMEFADPTVSTHL